MCVKGAFQRGACGSVPDPLEPQDAMCLYEFVLAGRDGAAGDGIGICNQLCDCTDACNDPGANCYALTSVLIAAPTPTQVDALWGRQGVCINSAIAGPWTILSACSP